LSYLAPRTQERIAPRFITGTTSKNTYKGKLSVEYLTRNRTTKAIWAKDNKTAAEDKTFINAIIARKARNPIV
jgi:hypothetical protein